jgi:parallel beta-helix repeat protein
MSMSANERRRLQPDSRGVHGGDLTESREYVRDLLGNTANNNEFAGFAPGMSVENTFSGNTANLNGRNGFEIHLFSNVNVFSENTANNNGAAGFGVGSSSNDRFVANIAHHNENGFSLSQSNDNVLEDNTAIRNAFGGYALGESSNNTLIDNRAKTIK